MWGLLATQNYKKSCCYEVNTYFMHICVKFLIFPRRSSFQKIFECCFVLFENWLEVCLTRPSRPFFFARGIEAFLSDWRFLDEQCWQWMPFAFVGWTFLLVWCDISGKSLRLWWQIESCLDASGKLSSPLFVEETYNNSIIFEAAATWEPYFWFRNRGCFCISDSECEFFVWLEFLCSQASWQSGWIFGSLWLYVCISWGIEYVELYCIVAPAVWTTLRCQSVFRSNLL